MANRLKIEALAPISRQFSPIEIFDSFSFRKLVCLLRSRSDFDFRITELLVIFSPFVSRSIFHFQILRVHLIAVGRQAYRSTWKAEKERNSWLGRAKQDTFSAKVQQSYKLFSGKDLVFLCTNGNHHFHPFPFSKNLYVPRFPFSCLHFNATEINQRD